MAITVTTDQKKEVRLAMKGGEVTAWIGTLKERASTRASIVFARVGRGMKRLIELLPAAAAGGDGATRKISLEGLSDDEMEAVLEHGADMLDDLIRAGAYGLASVDGLNAPDGTPLTVPATLEGREDFIDTYFKFPQILQLAMAAMEFNTVTEADAGNSP